ncbi:glutathione S-transferase D7 isoform X2 [Bradysia coprophila]|uniref:glutathione S-transferase D7 isoform X2 n=1 Tax=Bradysia coprophila TaxID=38358 RepID=UPI00187D8E13|nr:glutathione S-transferase D7 isoform X2 [Bradysia coprophila]
MDSDSDTVLKGAVKGDKVMPVLYFLPPSPPCRAVMMLARMIDVNFELKPVNVMEQEQFKPEFVAINPQHCIPTMDDTGLVLWESRAIMTYLVSEYATDDSLYPKDVKVRALVDQRIQFDLGTLYARMTDYYFPTMIMGAPLDETKKARLDEALGWFDVMLKGRTWCAANSLTVADITLLVTVSQIEAMDFDIKPYARVAIWLNRCKGALEAYGYEEINQTGCDVLASLFRSKLK